MMLSYKKNIIAGILAGSLLFIGGASMAHGQSDTAKKALESVKESVDTLIGAKDENNPNDAVFRVEAFKKVLDFSITEIKDLKVKLLASLDNEASSTISWKDNVIDRIDSALAYYVNEQDAVKKNPDMTLNEIKKTADTFKTWREDTYLPLSDEITDFLFIKQQGGAINTTEARFKKVSEDVIKLQKAFGAKKVQFLSDLLQNAASSTGAAKDLNTQAQTLFGKRYISPLFATGTIATSTKDETDVSTSTKTTSSDNKNTLLSATSSASTSTISLPPPASIKDLVRESLTKVKDTYKVFIDMSNLVRKLLG